MPPTNQELARKFMDQPAPPTPDDVPLAEATGEFYHFQYAKVLALLQQFPLLLLYSTSAGTGKTHIVRQVAEQLVMGQQLISLPTPYTTLGLHQSVEHAYRHGGVILLTASETTDLEACLRFAGCILAGHPLIGLHHPVRPERHTDFRLVVEFNLFDGQTIPNYNPGLFALCYQIHQDASPVIGLYDKLLTRLFTTKKAQQAFHGLMGHLPKENHFSLHLLQVLGMLPNNVEQAALLEMLTQGLNGTLPLEAATHLATLRGEKSENVKTGKVRAPKEVAGTEQQSPEEQSTALQQVVADFEHPTVKPVADAVAVLFSEGKPALSLSEDEDLGF